MSVLPDTWPCLACRYFLPEVPAEPDEDPVFTIEPMCVLAVNLATVRAGCDVWAVADR